MNLYEKSWSIYKAHSESFTDDFDYYFKFTKGKKTLETFAGYGRVSNFLHRQGIDISVNELSPDFTKFINIPTGKIHIGDVLNLNLNLNVKYERVFAAYNSFCLLTEENKVRKLFSVLEQCLVPGGMISLSYYHPHYWSAAADYTFDFEGVPVRYTPSFNLDLYARRRGIWKDIYTANGEVIEHEYEVKIYDSISELEEMISHTQLKIVDEISNYNNPNILEPGWIEYVLKLPS